MKAKELLVLYEDLVCLRDTIFYCLGCHVFICDFHREQAWERWLNKKSNDCSEWKKDILPRLRSIAKSRTIEKMQGAINALMISEFWTGKLRQHMTKYWLNIKEVRKFMLNEELVYKSSE